MLVSQCKNAGICLASLVIQITYMKLANSGFSPKKIKGVCPKILGEQLLPLLPRRRPPWFIGAIGYVIVAMTSTTALLIGNGLDFIAGLLLGLL